MQNIIGTEDFRKNLDDWLTKNNQRNAEWLFKNKTKIPPMFNTFSLKLHRGMTVDESFMEEVNSNKMKFLAHTSWSKDISTAMKRINDPAFSMVTNKKEKPLKILISKTIPKNLQIIDIHTFVMFMGAKQLEMQGFNYMGVDTALKGSEVLVSKGIGIKIADITVFT